MTDYYAVIAPKWRAPGRPTPGLGSRRWLRWQVVCETRPVVHANGVISSGVEHHSLHWRFRSAYQAAKKAQRKAAS